MVYTDLPIVARRAILASDWQDVAVRHHLYESGHALPCLRLEERVRIQFSEECLDLVLAVLYDPDFSDYQVPRDIVPPNSNTSCQYPSCSGNSKSGDFQGLLF